MVELDGSTPSNIMSQIGQLHETWGDGGCWIEVLTGASQRANALLLYPEEIRAEKGHAIADVLSRITGHHDPKTSKELCQKLEEIVPLSPR